MGVVTGYEVDLAGEARLTPCPTPTSERCDTTFVCTDTLATMLFTKTNRRAATRVPSALCVYAMRYCYDALR